MRSGTNSAPDRAVKMGIFRVCPLIQPATYDFGHVAIAVDERGRNARIAVTNRTRCATRWTSSGRAANQVIDPA